LFKNCGCCNIWFKEIQVANEAELNNWKNKDIAHLSRKGIINFTNKSQLKLIGVPLDKLKSRFQLNTEEVDRDVDSLDKFAKKVKQVMQYTIYERV
jgi:hypothetical protein